MRKIPWFALMLFLALCICCAQADVLTFPSDLTTIAEEAFAGDTSLDEAVLLAHPKPNSELPRKDSDTALTLQEVDILEMKKKSSQKVQELIIKLEALVPKECK